MGILNLTPDSFFAPSRYNMAVFDSGADIIDIGACSTRPGSVPVSEEAEWARIAPVLSNLPSGHPEISIDTFRSGIARRAYELIGPFIINDVSGAADREMLDLAREKGLKYIAMHPGGPADPPGVAAFFRELASGMEGIDWILDPGFGFEKNVEDNWTLLENLEIFKEFGREILVGISRKRMTGGSAELTRKANALALEHGADILRVHDVRDARETVEGYLSTI